MLSNFNTNCPGKLPLAYSLWLTTYPPEVARYNHSIGNKCVFPEKNKIIIRLLAVFLRKKWQSQTDMIYFSHSYPNWYGSWHSGISWKAFFSSLGLWFFVVKPFLIAYSLTRISHQQRWLHIQEAPQRTIVVYVSWGSDAEDVIISAGLWWTLCKISRQIEKVTSSYNENTFRKLTQCSCIGKTKFL